MAGAPSGDDAHLPLNGGLGTFDHSSALPYLLVYVFSIKSGWRRWYRRCRNYVYRFGGSRIIRKWTFQLHKGKFLDRLKQAQRNIATRVRDTYGPSDA
jgi:hypothetical protein